MNRAARVISAAMEFKKRDYKRNSATNGRAYHNNKVEGLLDNSDLAEKGYKSLLCPQQKSNSDLSQHLDDQVCLIGQSPFRILKVGFFRKFSSRF